MRTWTCWLIHFPCPKWPSPSSTSFDQIVHVFVSSVGTCNNPFSNTKQRAPRLPTDNAVGTDAVVVSTIHLLIQFEIKRVGVCVDAAEGGGYSTVYKRAGVDVHELQLFRQLQVRVGT